MGSPTFSREGGQRLTAFPPLPPFGASVFLAPKSSRSFQPELASLSSWRGGGWFPGTSLAFCRGPGPRDLRACFRVEGAPEGPRVLGLGCRCHKRRDAMGQMGGPICQSCALALRPSWLAHVRWTHFDRIRGTPSSTVTTVAPEHSPDSHALRLCSIACGLHSLSV